MGKIRLRLSVDPAKWLKSVETLLKMKFSLTYKTLSLFLMLVFSILSSSSHARSTKEYDLLFDAAEKVNKETIEPLKLVGKSVGCATGLLQDKGYSCTIPPPLQGFGKFNGVLCKRYTTVEDCKISSVILDAGWDEKLSNAERKASYDVSKVRHITVQCYSP